MSDAGYLAQLTGVTVDEATADWVALAGTAILGVPALSLDRLARKVSRIRAMRVTPSDDPETGRLKDRWLARLEPELTGWTPWSRFCLWIGFTLSMVGGLLKLLFASGSAG